MLIITQDSNPFRAQDKLISLNGQTVSDVIDLRFNLEESNTVVIQRNNEIVHLNVSSGEIHSLNFIEDIPKVKTCKNKCVFCFVDQLPKGLRNTLYFKDDDWRLSFLCGNFVTLTNLADEDLDRIIKQKISPLYVSAQAITENMRSQLGLIEKTSFAQKLLKLNDAGIKLNTQIVLCPGLNDGKELNETLDFLSKLSNIESVGIVPVGLTKYHKRNLSLVTTKYAKELILKVDVLQKGYLESRKSRWLYLADEFYLLAGQSVPSMDYYEEFLQLENGIGLTRQWVDGLRIQNSKFKIQNLSEKKIRFITGKLFGPTLKESLNYLKILGEVQVIENNFFGSKVTVAGLITAKDIIEQVKLNDELVLIPDIMLNGNNLFLDGIHFDEVKQKLPNATLIPSTSPKFCEWLKIL